MTSTSGRTRVTTPTGASPTDDATSTRNRLVIGLLLVSAFVVILNETIMSVALPRLLVDLDISASTGQWLTTGFMLTMAVVIPITGFLLQRLSTRAVFLTAMTLFSVGTLLCAVAPGFSFLLLGRIVQACGTAIMMPLLMTTVMTLVPPSSRGRTMGNISIVISVAPAIGPTISGLILSVLDWRWLFLVVLPIALASLVLGALRVPNITEPRAVPVDVLSVILSAFGFGGLVYGLSALGESASGASPLTAVVPLAVGVLALVGFVLRQLRLQRSGTALLDLRTFRSRTFTMSILMLAISMMALFGTLIILPLYLQNVIGLSTLETGLLLLPGGLVMGLLSPVVGRLYDRIGPRALVIPGAILVSAAFWLLALLLRADTPVWLVLAAHVALSVGLALTFTPLFTASLGSVRPALYSHGSAILGTVQQLAGAAGTAILVAVFTIARIAASRGGASEAASGAFAVRNAFLAAAIISLFAILIAFFIRTPPLDSENGHGEHPDDGGVVEVRSAAERPGQP